MGMYVLTKTETRKKFWTELSEVTSAVITRPTVGCLNVQLVLRTQTVSGKLDER